jgi:hypothetical protein
MSKPDREAKGHGAPAVADQFHQTAGSWWPRQSLFDWPAVFQPKIDCPRGDRCETSAQAFKDRVL